MLHDASGATPLLTSDNPDVIAALIRVEASLQVVLTAITILKAEMAGKHRIDVPLRPDDSWVGTP